MERSFWSTIRGKLLSRTLMVVLIPVLVIGGVAVASLASLSSTADDSLTTARTTLNGEVVGARVADASEQIARELAIFLDERVADAEDWATDIGLINAAKAANGRAIVRGLPEMPIDQIEAEFEGEPRLGDVHVERDLKQSVEATPEFKEIFLTDVNGFNVDYSNPTSDFVQSDESWWTRAMENGIDISKPEFDASAGVFALDISVRLDDEGVPVGVLKAALDINVVQVIADRFAGGADGFEVTIVDRAGRFLAETSSGHEPSHIMNEIFLASNPTASTAMVREVFEPNAAELHADGFSIDENGVGGFAHVGDQLVTLRSDMDADLRAFDWTVVVEQPAEIAFAAIAPLEGLANEVESTSSTLTFLLIAVAIVGILAAIGMALLFAQRITSPIAKLRDAAMTAAEVTLPNVVSQIDALEPDEELPALEPLVLRTGDEVEDLAHSFNSVQQTAANLASDQARMRRKNVATTFVNLGRRNQNLLSRQLEHINSMESTETNSETLQRLFQLDHLATRMRRNAESLLVLAGEETPRRFRQPVTMHQLLQAAGGEIEDFGRIELTALDEAAVEGGAASDVAHLLAELLENASTYSPPGAPIQVHGRRRQNGYLLAIVDQGIGMEEEAIAAANMRLSDPAEFDRAPSAYLGHFVVGHLAKRHGIRVRLGDSPYGGVAAQLHLPAQVLASTQVADRVGAPLHDGATETIGESLLDDSAFDDIEVLSNVVGEEIPRPVNGHAVVVPDEPVVTNGHSGSAPGEAPETAPFDYENSYAIDGAGTEPFASPVPDPEVFVEAHESNAYAPQPVAEPHQFHDSPEQIFGTESDGIAPPPTVETAGQPAPESPQPHDSVETTPSGFRRRKRGQEGAPQPLSPAASEPAPAPTRRTPEEVQASLQRFRHGVETGRAISANNDNSSDHPSYAGENQ